MTRCKDCGFPWLDGIGNYVREDGRWVRRWTLSGYTEDQNLFRNGPLGRRKPESRRYNQQLWCRNRADACRRNGSRLTQMDLR